MNRVMKQLVSNLLEGDLERARCQSKIFPSYYGSKILDKQGNLTEFGLWDAVDFPFPRNLSAWLCKCLVSEASTDTLPLQFSNYARVFRLVNKASKDLSELAQVKAIQSMQIYKQCAYLGISFEEIEGLEADQRVELSVSQYYSKSGFESINLEGGEFLVLMRCASWTFLSKACRANETPYLEALLVDSKDPSSRNRRVVDSMLEGISDSNRNSVTRSFNRIYPNTSLEKTYPGLTSSFIGNLYEVIGMNNLFELAKCFAEDPYRYRKGWPDVTGYRLDKRPLRKNDARLFLREVKVKDKLRPSQIITLRKLKKLIPDIGVVKVSF
ncbi:hypothetical protein [Microbulbifer sp. VAAF005]|uniref:hypothetical protein n=1 Tax=Microbulbifer sp. VAAF005 TaxID=3034230 RepID=UPI0024AD2DB4|nr:hypothetical protein [Microbulbifer sp. VAAF005]WHI48958.1 hypothetical protein P0078_11580 [Microbulbifer sp. VAAF005]